MIPPQQDYHVSEPPALLISFDLRDPEAVQQLHHERAAWQEQGDLEALDENHCVFIIRPGGAKRLLR